MSVPEAGGRRAEVELADGVPGLYHVAVTSRADGPVTTRADLSTLGIDTFDGIGQIRRELHSGDSLTLTIRGTGFTSSTQFTLGGRPAMLVSVVDTNTAIVTFVNLAPGQPLALAATAAGVTAFAPGPPFRVLPRPADPLAALANWTIDVQMPQFTRPTWEIPVTIHFRNDSAVSQPTPVISVATDNGSFRFASESLFVGDQLGLLGVKPTGRPDAYAPGESGSIALVLAPIRSGAGIVSEVVASIMPEQEVRFVGAGGTIVPIEQSIPLRRNAFDEYRPNTMSDRAWNAVVRANLESIIGDTAESYASALRFAAARLAEDNAETRDVTRLMSYLVRVADDFGEISSRFESSAFGMGQNNPYDIRIETDINGNLLVRSGTRTRPFARQGSIFIGVDGDRGTITMRAGGGWILTEPSGTAYSFRSDGQWEYTQDIAGNRLTAAYEGNRLSSMTNVYGDVTTLTYDAHGNVTAITNALGQSTTYSYDPTGQFLTSITTLTGTTTYEYDTETASPSAYAVTRITDSVGVTWNYEYDAHGGIARVSRNGGQLPIEIRYGAGAEMGMVTTVDPSGAVSVITRGEFGQLSAWTDASGFEADLQYDRQGRLIAVKSIEGRVELVRDSFGNITAILSAAGIELQAGYDSNSTRATNLIDPLDRTHTFTHLDTRLSSGWIQPDGAAASITRDEFGRIVATTNESGHEVRRTYDAIGQLARIDFADGSRIDYSRNSMRNLTEIAETNADGQVQAIRLTYDAAGRATSVTDPNGRVVTYEYDSFGRLFRTTADGIIVESTFDDLSRLAEIRREGVLQVSYTYDPAGNLASKVFANGTRTVYSYDVAARVSRIEHLATSGEVLDFLAYARDRAGRIVSMSTPDGTTTYEHDVRGQLVGVVLPDGTTHRFDTDSAGNRLGHAIDSGNRYLTDPAGRQFQYDSLGNLTRVIEPGGATTTYQYDLRNRLIGISGPAGDLAFEYDPLGTRSAGVQDGVRTELLLDPFGGATGLANVLAEYQEGTARASYLIADGILARFDRAGDPSYYHYDAIGNTAAITSAGGEVTASYRYLPFGEILSQDGEATTDNPYTFHGQWGIVDRGLGLYEMRARFYDSTLGRFTQPDPIGLVGGDLNLYRFVQNDPMTYIDPSGLQQVGDSTTTKEVKPVDPAPKPGDKPRNPIPAPVPQPPPPPPPPAEPKPDIFTPSPEITEGEETGPIPLFDPADFPREVTTPGQETITPGNVTVEPFVPSEIGAYAMVFGLGAPIAILAGLAASRLLPAAAPVAAPLVLREGGKQLAKVAVAAAGTYKAAAEGPTDPSPRAEGRGRTQQVGPVDPNDITGPGGVGEALFRQPGGNYGYTIRFQNMPDATAPAQVVLVTQQLDPDLDWDSFQLAEFGWGDLRFDVEPGRQSYTTRIDDPARDLVVEVSAAFDAASGALSWAFRSLDQISLDQPADPFAGFLPPDDASGRGQGFVRYTIQPRPGAMTGTRYDAQASIVFDTEAEILTNIHANTIDASPPVSRVDALPATSPASFQVRWGGTDDGSGIRSYDIWAQADDGPWQLWLNATTQTTATFVGVPGSTYRFVSVATDEVGHVEPIRAVADTATRVVVPIEPPPPPPVDADAPRVLQVVVNGGDAQRSRVTSVQVWFDSVVTVLDDAFRIVRHDGRRVGVQVQSHQLLDSRSVVTLAFTGMLVQAGSLPDGLFTLHVIPDRVTSAGGHTLAPAGKASSNGNPIHTFHRFFGDMDGNGRVDRADLLAFRRGARSQFGDARFVPGLDINDDQRINRVDAFHFLQRLGRGLPRILPRMRPFPSLARRMTR